MSCLLSVVRCVLLLSDVCCLLWGVALVALVARCALRVVCCGLCLVPCVLFVVCCLLIDVRCSLFVVGCLLCVGCGVSIVAWSLFVC